MSYHIVVSEHKERSCWPEEAVIMRQWSTVMSTNSALRSWSNKELLEHDAKCVHADLASVYYSLLTWGELRLAGSLFLAG